MPMKSQAGLHYIKVDQAKYNVYAKDLVTKAGNATNTTWITIMELK